MPGPEPNYAASICKKEASSRTPALSPAGGEPALSLPKGISRGAPSNSKQNSPVKPRVPCGEAVSDPWIPESKLPPITKNPIKSIVRNILLTNPLFPRFYADVVIASAPNSNEAKILASNYQKIIDRTSMPNTRTCTHIKVTGVRCDSPALRGEQFCYFHQRMIRGVRTPPRSRLHPIAQLESEEAIQASLMEVINALIRDTIDTKRAELIIRALHIAVKNAHRARFNNTFDVVKGIVEPGAVGVLYRDVEGADDQLGALGVDGVANERVDDFHQRGLNGLFALELSDGMKTRARRSANAANHALVEVAELLSAESRGVAANSGDFDMSAGAGIGHGGPIDDFLVVGS